MLRIAGRREARYPGTLWLAHDRPLAFSLTGRCGVIVATDGLSRHLPGPAVDAVLAHERAHLAGRHHLLIAAADALRSALAFVPLFRHAPGAVRDLVELAADVAAVRRCGASAVRSALVSVSGHGTPRSALGMARDAVDLRLARLRVDAAASTRSRVVLWAGRRDRRRSAVRGRHRPAARALPGDLSRIALKDAFVTPGVTKASFSAVLTCRGSCAVAGCCRPRTPS